MSKLPREWWIGITNTGFTKWLTSKHPQETECKHAFICSDNSEICIEYVPVIEMSAHLALQEKAKRLEIKLKISKDSQLRTYDGLAEKADSADALAEENISLKSKLDCAVKALEFYGKEANWSDYGTIVLEDNGNYARQALKEIGGGE